MKKPIFFIFFFFLFFSIALNGCGNDQKNGQVIIPREEGQRTFQDTGDALCTIDGKPVIREFSTTWCPHCQWIKQTFQDAVEEYVEADQIVAFQWDVDINDDALTAEKEKEVPFAELEVFRKYNEQGGVPTFIFGCRYVRIGNGYEQQNNLEAEEAEFREIIEELISMQNN